MNQPILRKNIRNQVIEILKGADTLAGDNVFASRTAPVQSGALPSIAVYLFNESSQGNAHGTAPMFTVTLTIVVSAYAEAPSDGDLGCQLDDLVDQIKDALLTNAEFVKTFGWINKVTVQFDYKDDATKLVVGNANIAIEVVYEDYYEPNIPDILLGADIYARNDDVVRIGAVVDFE